MVAASVKMESRGGIPPQKTLNHKDLKINTTAALLIAKYRVSCFSEDGGPQYYLKIRAGEIQK